MKPWSHKEHARLRSLYPKLPTADVATYFPGRSFLAIRSRARVLKLRKRPGVAGWKKEWSKREDKQLRALYPHMSTAKVAKQFGRSLESVNGRAQNLGLRKTQAYLDSPDACRLRRGDNVGAAFRFKKGLVPHNKGLRRPGWFRGRMRETQFKKGQKPWTWKPIGSLRFSKEGYLQRKISDTGYPPHDWVGVHILIWVEVHGPVPPGHAVTFKDGDKKHIVLDNLELISRAELMRRNTVHNLPPDLAQVIQLRGALNRRIRRMEREEHDSRSAQSSV